MLLPEWQSPVSRRVDLLRARTERGDRLTDDRRRPEVPVELLPQTDETFTARRPDRAFAGSAGRHRPWKPRGRTADSGHRRSRTRQLLPAGAGLGITGSNGKTTTTALIGHLLKECGISCQVGGNIGHRPTAMVADSRDDQWNVLELSSFQLETIDEFRANIGVVQNVTPDHLDRHHTFENYADAKGGCSRPRRRLTRGTERGRSHLRELCVAHHGDAVTGSAAEAGAEVRLSTAQTIFVRGATADRCGRTPDPRPHNVENVMAAAGAARSWRARLDGDRRSGANISGRRASARIRARAERRALLQRFEGDQRGRD